MKLLMLLISAIFVVAILDVPVHAAQTVQFEDGPRVKNPFMLKIKGLYRAKKYAELDAMADSFSSTKNSFFPDGGSKLRTFSSTFELEGDYPESVYTSCIGLGEGWRRARPTSVPARIALAQHWLDYAWKARGHGYAKEVKENAWPEFRKRLDTAWKIINEPPAPGVADSPERHCLRLKLATYRSVERGDFDALFRESVHLYPNYINLYIRGSSAESVGKYEFLGA